MRLRVDDALPTATVHPRTPGDHARGATSKLCERIQRATVNPVTRSQSFVGGFGAILLTVLACAIVHKLGSTYEIAHEIGIPYHDGPCAGKVSCPELNK